MPSIMSHAIAAAALVAPFPKSIVPRRIAVVGAVCSMVPDLDVIGFGFGIKYGDLLGHRGLSHSLAFAALTGLAAMLLALRKPGTRLAHPFGLWLYLFLATASHGLLDALTDGGLGIALFSPFDATRYFLPWTPIAVSPIGPGFFSAQGMAVLLSEMKWVWAPSLAFAASAILVRRALEKPANRNT